MGASYIVRYGAMRNLGEFSARDGQAYLRDAAVIVRTERGVEWGTVLSAASERSREYLRQNGEPGRILREVAAEDHRTRDEIALRERDEFALCRTMIGERSLQMQLIDAEHLFGGERVVFYYLAEKRVDFRELVKALAKELRTRIEMRQIGVRDEARLLADYGDCGMPVCCGTYLQEMPPVSMKMAKLQKATLDPTKISGRCGRLKCCLRYEYDTYEEFRRELPPVGAMVVTKNGQGKVIAQEILARKVMVVYDGNRHILTDERDVVTVVSSRAAAAPATSS